MPTDFCLYFYECLGCGATLRPLENDCCVFCSYGSVPCLPIQQEKSRAEWDGCCSDRVPLAAGSTAPMVEQRTFGTIERIHRR